MILFDKFKPDLNLDLDLISTKLNIKKMERTFIMIKPDGVQRGLVGQIIARFEAKGFFLVAMKMKTASE